MMLRGIAPMADRDQEDGFSLDGGDDIGIQDLPAKLRIGAVCGGMVGLELSADHPARGLARVIERGIRVEAERTACALFRADATARRDRAAQMLADAAVQMRHARIWWVMAWGGYAATLCLLLWGAP